MQRIHHQIDTAVRPAAVLVLWNTTVLCRVRSQGEGKAVTLRQNRIEIGRVQWAEQVGLHRRTMGEDEKPPAPVSTPEEVAHRVLAWKQRPDQPVMRVQRPTGFGWIQQRRESGRSRISVQDGAGQVQRHASISPSKHQTSP